EPERAAGAEKRGTLAVYCPECAVQRGGLCAFEARPPDGCRYPAGDWHELSGGGAACLGLPWRSGAVAMARDGWPVRAGPRMVEHAGPWHSAAGNVSCSGAFGGAGGYDTHG